MLAHFQVIDDFVQLAKDRNISIISQEIFDHDPISRVENLKVGVILFFFFLFPGTSGSISMKLGMKHQRFKLIIFRSNDNPVLILTHFTARSNFAHSAFILENVIMVDTLF